MKITVRFAPLVVLAASFVLASASAQSNPPAQDQPSAQDQAPSSASGVSHPPSDDTIKTDEDDAPPSANPPAPKPSAATPMPAATFPPPVAATPAAPSTTPLARRVWDPDDDIVSVVPSNPNELASGTNIRVRLSQDLSTADTRRGDAFRAVVDHDVYKDGRLIIPVGAEMRGQIVQVTQGHHIGLRATLRLRPETIMLPDGTSYHIDAQAVESKAPGTRTDQEGGIQTSPHYKKDAIEYGAGAGIGAIAGGEIAGPVGAGVGSVVGASAVTAHMLMGRPDAANLPQGSILVFSLTEPMALTPTRATAN
jgi:hypothetical protein